MRALNWLDYTIIGIVLISLIIGLFRGFVREALSVAFWVLAFWVAFTFAEMGAVYLEPYIHSAGLRLVASFFILFALTLIVGSILSALIVKVVEKTGLTGTDRLLGIVFGIGRGVLLVALLLLLCEALSISQNSAWKASQLVPHFQPLVVWLKSFLPSDFIQSDKSLEKADENK